MTCYFPKVCYYLKSEFEAFHIKKLYFDVPDVSPVERDTLLRIPFPVDYLELRKNLFFEKRHHLFCGRPINRNDYVFLTLPCGKCLGCRSDNANMKTTRCMHELQYCKSLDGSTNACFITLTYDDNSDLVKSDPYCVVDLRYKHFQNFIKRLRKYYSDHNLSLDSRFKYLVCGEYGPKHGRAHFHAILFHFNFYDRKFVFEKNGVKHYQSDLLNRFWSTYTVSGGFNSIGFTDLTDVSYKACSYVCQYVLKKSKEFKALSPLDDFIYDVDCSKLCNDYVFKTRVPELVRSSGKIGLSWFLNNVNVVANHRVTSFSDKSKFIKVPRYYEDKLRQLYPVLYEKYYDEKMKIIDDLKCKGKLRVFLNDLNSHMSAHLLRIKRSLKQSFDQNFKKLIS